MHITQRLLLNIRSTVAPTAAAGSKKFEDYSVAEGQESISDSCFLLQFRSAFLICYMFAARILLSISRLLAHASLPRVFYYYFLRLLVVFTFALSFGRLLLAEADMLDIYSRI